MKILHVTLDLPYPPMRGAQIRDYALIRRASSQHDVSLVTFAEGAVPEEDVSQMRRLCPDVIAIPRPAMGLVPRIAKTISQLCSGLPLAATNYVYPEVEAEIRARLQTGTYVLLQIEHSFLAPYVRAAEGVAGVSTLLSLHNVGSVQYPRMARIERGFGARAMGHLKAWLMQGWERRWANRFDHVVTMSRSDSLALGCDSPTSVVPNGVEMPAAPLPRPEGHNLLFVGNLQYPPNVDAARHMVADILPKLRATDAGVTLTIAGFDPPADMLAGLDVAGVEVIANAPDLTPLYERAVAVVVPLRAGGGTRLKILEAMAMGRPVISTTIGAEGLDLEDGKTILIADDADAFANQVQRLLGDEVLWADMASNGRGAITEWFTWDAIWQKLDQIYQDITGPQNHGTNGAVPPD